ncbi:MAG: response regulator [Bacillota bacterium]|jgi:two-component system response regulator YesN
MLRIMIVDDEPLERQGIKLILETYRPQDQIVGEAGDGEEAIQVATRVKPDVILLDIRMPGLDGIEVAKILRPILPDTRIVVISAHSEFSYAKKAVALGTSDYLLKPVDTEEMIDLLDHLEAEVSEERESKEEMERLRTMLKDAMPLIRVGFVMDLINGSLTNDEEVNSRAKFLGIHQPLRLALHIWIDDLSGLKTYRSELEHQILQKKVSDAIQEAINDWPGALLVQIGSGQFVILLPFKADEEEGVIRENSQKLGDHICCVVRTRTKATVTVGLGRPAKNAAGLARSHTEALTAGEFRLIYGGDQAIHADDVTTPHEKGLLLEQGNEKGMAMAIRMGDWEKTKQHFLALWADMPKEQMLSAADIRMKLLEVSALASRSAIEGGVKVEEITSLSIPTDKEISFLNSLPKIHEQVLSWLGELVGRVRSSREFRNASLVEKAVHYMEENFQMELSLEDVAQQVYLSPCYFSRLFKQVKGWSFSEYLTQVRMEEARRLLINSDLQISEIAARVGYRDARYFSQVFKRNEGCTPISYRRDGMKIN